MLELEYSNKSLILSFSLFFSSFITFFIWKKKVINFSPANIYSFNIYLSLLFIPWGLRIKIRIDNKVSGLFRHPVQWIIKISFSLESYIFMGSVVPIASWLIIRPEFYNGAFTWNFEFHFFFWVNFLSFYWLKALNFLFSEQIYLIIMNESVLMLYYIAFLTVTS